MINKESIAKVKIKETWSDEEYLKKIMTFYETPIFANVWGKLFKKSII